MMDRNFIYDMVYALAAKDGREQTLFGSCASGGREAFSRSLACEAFPELWFEVPLAGNPWFDLHALTAREDVEPDMAFASETCGGFPDTFAWFATQDNGVKQLALSWDVGSGEAKNPAVQLLVSTYDQEVTCDFLVAAGRPDAVPAYRAFTERLPRKWFACYAGVFPTRPRHNLRVECIPDRNLQCAYADDADLLERHLRHTGLQDLGDTIIPRCQALAQTPFQLEFQFDVNVDGTPGSTFGASARFACPPGDEGWKPYDIDGAAGELMRQAETWGLVDDRWRDLAGTIFAKRASHNDESMLLYCYPAFLKLRWRNGQPLDAKAYLIAGAQ